MSPASSAPRARSTRQLLVADPDQRSRAQPRRPAHAPPVEQRAVRRADVREQRTVPVRPDARVHARHARVREPHRAPRRTADRVLVDQCDAAAVGQDEFEHIPIRPRATERPEREPRSHGNAPGSGRSRPPRSINVTTRTFATASRRRVSLWRTPRTRGLLIVATLAGLFGVAALAAHVYTDLLWFAEVGQPRVYCDHAGVEGAAGRGLRPRDDVRPAGQRRAVRAARSGGGRSTRSARSPAGW